MSGTTAVPPHASLPLARAARARPVGRVPIVDRAETGAPIFIHSGWRTSSTWLWTKLRQAPTTFAYCEIFHERLETLTIDYLRENDFSRWKSKHPEGAPYFLEFAQLFDGDGTVRGFDRSMATERFIPGEGLAGALSAQERSYVAGLIDYAYARRRIPVLDRHPHARPLRRARRRLSGTPCAARTQRLPPVGILHGAVGQRERLLHGHAVQDDRRVAARSVRPTAVGLVRR